MRVLVVEDYEPVRTAIVKSLRKEGYSVDEAPDGNDGLAAATDTAYDVIVLDLMLPGLDGFELLERLRAGGSRSQVLMLTARDGIDDRVRGLDLGADDYLIKPFAMAELMARVRVLVRHSYDTCAPRLEVGHLTVDTVGRQAWVDGSSVDLTAKEYALLEYLALRAGQVVTRAEIWEHLYDERSEATSNVVDVYIGYLRRKLHRTGRGQLIHTRRGEGYVLRGEEA